MAKFILDGQEYGGGSGNKIVKLTQAEYDALPNDKLSDDIIYLIKDSGELTAENLFYDGSVTGLGNTVQDAVDNLDEKVSEQNKNLFNIQSLIDYWMSNNILPDPNIQWTTSGLSIYSNRCSIVSGGYRLDNKICYIDITIKSNIGADSYLNNVNASTMITGFPTRATSGMQSVTSNGGTFGIQDGVLYAAKVSSGITYNITGSYTVQ